MCLPPPKPQTRPHCSTCPRVSGSFRARELPRARAAEAKRMGAALVIPTKDVKMLIPSTAASLHRAFKKPKAVVLSRGPPAQHRWVSPGGRRGGGMGGFVGEGRGSRSERRGAVSEGGRKGRVRRGEGCAPGNIDKSGGRGKGDQKIGLIVKTSRSEYKSYQLLEEKLSGNVYPSLPEDACPIQPHFLAPLVPCPLDQLPCPHHTPTTSCPRGRVRQSTRPARSRMQC